MRVPKWLAATVAVALIALSAGLTLLFTDRLPAHETLPAGCIRAEENRPGCHPTATRVSANTVAALTVIVSPLATLLVAVVAVGATKTRQTEQLAAERDRLDRELAHDRVLKDRQEIREILDALTGQAHRYRDLLSRSVRARDLDGRQIFACLDDLETSSNRLLVRLGFDHPVYTAYSNLLAHMEVRFALADSLIDEGAGVEDERWGASGDVAAADFRALIDAALPQLHADLDGVT